ncbi:MAG: UDP-glucuronosyltransferase [Rhodocyclales bacterium]|nr:UDP-glucuronosyltransferase [Rhodocyclales bacterium]
MSRFLFAWELGGNFGHVGQFLPVAERLRAMGHDVGFAVRDVTQAAPFLRPGGFPFVQAPVAFPRWRGANPEPASYAEILANSGWDTPDNLAALVHAWRVLFRWIGPDVVVGSHAPTALLAARAAGRLRAELGTGFECPPRRFPFPAMRWWREEPVARLEQLEAPVLDAANRALDGFGGKPASALFELFDYEAELLCTLAELDHYPEREGGAYLGPLYVGSSGQPPRWPAGEGKRVFVYLRPRHAGLERLLADLSALDARAIVFAPGVGDDLVSRYGSARMVFAREPVRISEVARQCDLAVCHGGHGTTAAFLLAGVPLLLLPSHLEQYLVARNVVALGAGMLLGPEAAGEGFAGPLDALLRRPDAAVRAQAFRERYRAVNTEDTVLHVAQRLAELAQSRTATPSPANSKPPEG